MTNDYYLLQAKQADDDIMPPLQPGQVHLADQGLADPLAGHAEEGQSGYLGHRQHLQAARSAEGEFQVSYPFPRKIRSFWSLKTSGILKHLKRGRQQSALRRYETTRDNTFAYLVASDMRVLIYGEA